MGDRQQEVLPRTTQTWDRVFLLSAFQELERQERRALRRLWQRWYSGPRYSLLRSLRDRRCEVCIEYGVV